MSLSRFWPFCHVRGKGRQSVWSKKTTAAFPVYPWGNRNGLYYFFFYKFDSDGLLYCTFYNAHCALHKYMRKRSNVVLYGEVHGVDHSAVHRNVLINVVKMNSILFQIFWEEKWALLVCQILLDPFVLRCAVVIFRQDGLAREGECVFCPCGYQSRRWRFGFGTRGVGRGSEWRGEGGEVKVLLGKWGWGHEDGQ